jgi:methionine--tRNA ligase beta chain
METISFDEFKKVDVRVGTILTAEKVEGSDKLLRLEVDFGMEAEIPVKRQIIAGIGQFYAPETLIGKQCPFAFNLAPRTLKGLESQGMILCPDNSGKPCLLHPDKEIPPGSIVK